MGAIRSFIQGLDGASDLVKEQNAHLDALSALATAKAEIFEAKIYGKIINAGVGTDKSIAISDILSSTKETHAYSSGNGQKITETVKSSISSFVDGGANNVIDGVSKLVAAAIDGLFGSTESSDMTMEKYFVAVEGYAIVRLDIMGWKRAITASSLTQKVEQVSAFVMVKSTVDTSKIAFNTFFNLYQKIILASDPTTDVLALLDKTKEIFDRFHSLQSEKRLVRGTSENSGRADMLLRAAIHTPNRRAESDTSDTDY